jgi:hypothetical protein
MGFYAKEEPARLATGKAAARTLSRVRKPKPRNAWPPILTVGIGHRFYSPSLGRWTARDPAGEIDVGSLQISVGNSPLNLVDPTGLLSWENRETKSTERMTSCGKWSGGPTVRPSGAPSRGGSHPVVGPVGPPGAGPGAPPRWHPIGGIIPKPITCACTRTCRWEVRTWEEGENRWLRCNRYGLWEEGVSRYKSEAEITMETRQEQRDVDSGYWQRFYDPGTKAKTICIKVCDRMNDDSKEAVIRERDLWPYDDWLNPLRLWF